MYSATQPAASIRELLQYLKASHQPDYVYRGQTRDYGSMLPSVFRRRPLHKKEGFYLLTEEDADTRLNIIRATFGYVLMEKYGNVVGNYLAQQYLAYSGCIDVTNEPDIAAFFATLAYPDYVEPLPAADHPGVIYRFDKRQFNNNIRPSGVKDVPFSIHAQKGDYSVFLEHSRVENRKVSPFSFTEPPIDDDHPYYTLAANISSFDDVQPFLTEIDARHRASKGADEAAWPSQFHRAVAQQGGMIQPRYLYKGPVPAGDFDPFLSNMVGVEDIYLQYGMEAFYFHHRGHPPGVTREMLWPNMWEDGTFGTLGLLLNKSRDRLGLPAGIRTQDIVDIGYPDNPHIDLYEDLPGWST